MLGNQNQQSWKILANIQTPNTDISTVPVVYGCPYWHLSHPFKSHMLSTRLPASSCLTLPQGYIPCVSSLWAVSFLLCYTVHWISFIGLTCDLLSRWCWSQGWKRMQNCASSGAHSPREILHSEVQPYGRNPLLILITSQVYKFTPYLSSQNCIHWEKGRP